MHYHSALHHCSVGLILMIAKVRLGSFKNLIGFLRFESDPVCGKPAPKVLLSEFNFAHKLFSGPKQHVPAMNREVTGSIPAKINTSFMNEAAVLVRTVA